MPKLSETQLRNSVKIDLRRDLFNYLRCKDFFSKSTDEEEYDEEEYERRMIQGSPASLSKPFSKILLQATRFGENYLAVVGIYPDERSDFHGLSKKIRQMLPKGWIYESTNPYGEGYISLTSEKGKSHAPDLSIICRQSENLPPCYEIHLGNSGTRTRSFSSFDDFDSDLNQLGDATSLFLNAGYSLFNRTLFKHLDTLYLTCP